MSWTNVIERTRFSIESAFETLRRALWAEFHSPTDVPALQFGELEDRVLMSATPVPPELIDPAAGLTAPTPDATADPAPLTPPFRATRRRPDAN
jgi:hypothetical protein